MVKLSETVQSGDWKGEKHVPVIEAPESAAAGEVVRIKVAVGEEIPHPNTFEHYIAWIKVYFKADDAKFPVEIASLQFTAHGEGELLTEPKACVNFKVAKSGVILAESYCNIHGLWENSVRLEVK